MGRLLERVFLLMVVVSLLLYGIEALLRGLSAIAARSHVVLAPVLTAAFVTTFVACAFVGLVVRVELWVQDRQRAAAGRRLRTDRPTHRAVRRTVETPGDQVPHHAPIDDDPALTFDGEADE